MAEGGSNDCASSGLILPPRMQRFKSFVDDAEARYRTTGSRIDWCKYEELKDFYESQLCAYLNDELFEDQTYTEIMLPPRLTALNYKINQEVRAYNRTKRAAHKESYERLRNQFLEELTCHLLSLPRISESWKPEELRKLAKKEEMACAQMFSTKSLRDIIRHDRLLTIETTIMSHLKDHIRASIQRRGVPPVVPCPQPHQGQGATSVVNNDITHPGIGHQQQQDQGPIPMFNPKIPPPGFGVNQGPVHSSILSQSIPLGRAIKGRVHLGNSAPQETAVKSKETHIFNTQVNISTVSQSVQSALPGRAIRGRVYQESVGTQDTAGNSEDIPAVDEKIFQKVYTSAQKTETNATCPTKATTQQSPEQVNTPAQGRDRDEDFPALGSAQTTVESVLRKFTRPVTEPVQQQSTKGKTWSDVLKPRPA